MKPPSHPYTATINICLIYSFYHSPPGQCQHPAEGLEGSIKCEPE